jgi:hypothetical protein
MRIRTIKPEFYLHEGLFELERESGLPIRLAFTGLWCAADREGRFKWEPRKIGVQILPYDAVDFLRVLDALITRGFVRKYSVDSVEYGWIPSFTRHQVINNRERPSDLPEPTDSNICDACPTREPRVPHAVKAEGKGREGNMERKGKDTPLPPKGDEEGGENHILPKNWKQLTSTERKQTRVNANSKAMNRIGRFFNRREGTLWSVAEAVALKNVAPTSEEIQIMEIYYLDGSIEKDSDFRRKDLITLLNNWSGELDRARIFMTENGFKLSPQ